MRTTLVPSLMLFAAASMAQTLFDPTLVHKVVVGTNDFLSSIIKNPLVTAAVTSLESLGVPAASISSAEADPVFLLENLVADYTDIPLINAIPTALGNTLRSVLAVPLKAVEDIAAFITYLEAQPDFQFALSELKKYVPTEVQQEFAASPIPFLKDLVEQNTVPTYFSAVPTPVVQGLAEIFNQGLGIVVSDFENPVITVPTIPSTGTIPYPTGVPRSVVTGVPSATGSLPYGYNSTRTSTGLRSPITKSGSVSGVASASGSLSYRSSKTYVSVGTGIHVHPTGSGATGIPLSSRPSYHQSSGTGVYSTGTGSHATGTGVGTSVASAFGVSPYGFYHAAPKPAKPIKGRSFGHQRYAHAHPFP